MKNKLRLILIGSVILALAGCATAPNVTLSQNFWQNHKLKQKVVVATDEIPVAGLYQTGSEGLLDYVMNDVVTSNFQTYLKHYPVQSLSKIKWMFLKKLQARHMNAKVYGRAIDTSKLVNYSGSAAKFATKNYTPLVAKIGPHKLLMVSVTSVGAERSYYGFIPLGAPKAICDLEGRLINLQNNRILWRYRVSVVLPIPGKWDQPPNYPMFTKTLQRAIVTAQQKLLDGFFAVQ